MLQRSKSCLPLQSRYFDASLQCRIELFGPDLPVAEALVAVVTRVDSDLAKSLVRSGSMFFQRTPGPRLVVCLGHELRVNGVEVVAVKPCEACASWCTGFCQEGVHSLLRDATGLGVVSHSFESHRSLLDFRTTCGPIELRKPSRQRDGSLLKSSQRSLTTSSTW